MVILRLTGWRNAAPFIWVALLAVLLHMVLDSLAAEIAWFKPFLVYEVNLIQVPAQYDWWGRSFCLHWTFLFKIWIVVAAGMMLWRDVKGRNAGKPRKTTKPAQLRGL